MCGICGFTGHNSGPHDPRLREMNTRLIHRGPDSDGYFTSPGIALAMRRLSIIDISGSDQPIWNEDRTLCLVFNGELYNYHELREQLLARNHTFTTHGDAECIIHLFEDHGPGCLHHLKGQFAFAIWNEKTSTLFLARDRFGEKPLYYTRQNGQLFFSSELPGLYQACNPKPEIDLSAIDLYLALQYIPEPLTAYQQIYKLPAGHYLLHHQDQLTIAPYWTLNYEPKHAASESELNSQLVRHVSKAVQQSLVSDVPLGAHLSGGIDSSIVVALMAEFASGPVKTFSVGFQEQSFSELQYARIIADRYSTDHHEFILEYGNIPETLAEIIRHIGEPLADSSMIPLYHLARLTRQHVTVALNGDGGDEIFGGYMRYWLDPLADQYLRIPSVARQILLAAIRPLRDNADKPIGGSIINGLKRFQQIEQTDKRASMLRWSSYFSAAQRDRLWSNQARRGLDVAAAQQFLVDTYQNAPAESRLDRTLYTDIKTYLPGDLLVKSDRMTMAHSLEGRSPFLDHELAQWAARLPTNMKVRGRTGKYLLRKAFEGRLPPAIKNRGKQGFGVPIGSWLRKPLAKWSRELLLSKTPAFTQWFNQTELEQILSDHQAGRADHGRRIWALITLALWLESGN